MIKITIIFVVLLCGIIVNPIGYCQDVSQEENITTVSGEVVNIDWVSRKMVIALYKSGPSDEVTVIVSRDTKITKGTAPITFADIHITDSVTIQYYSNSFVGLQAVQITVQ